MDDDSRTMSSASIRLKFVGVPWHGISYLARLAGSLNQSESFREQLLGRLARLSYNAVPQLDKCYC